MIFAAIDPGADGAIAIFNDKTLLRVESLTYHLVGKQKMLQIGSHILRTQMQTHSEKIERVFIEEVNFIKGQGGVSSFSFGQRFGEAKCLARSLSDSVVFISPMKWKRTVGLIGQDKKQSAIMAANIYPNQEGFFVEKNNRCKDGFKYYDGRGDAVMLGLAAIKLGMTE